MKLALAVLALPLAAFVSGCSPAVSVRPLYTDADLKKPILEPRIEGEWISPDLDKAGTDEELSLKWKIDPPKRPGLSYSVEVRTAKSDPQEGEEVTSYNVRLVPIADKLFFDADFDEQKYEQHKIGRDAILGMAPAHLIGRVWVQQDFLRIALFDSDWVKDNSPESFREMVSASDTDIAVFTGSTAELRKFVLQNANNEKAFLTLTYHISAGRERNVQRARLKTHSRSFRKMKNAETNCSKKQRIFISYGEISTARPNCSAADWNSSPMMSRSLPLFARPFF